MSGARFPRTNWRAGRVHAVEAAVLSRNPPIRRLLERHWGIHASLVCARRPGGGGRAARRPGRHARAAAVRAGALSGMRRGPARLLRDGRFHRARHQQAARLAEKALIKVIDVEDRLPWRRAGSHPSGRAMVLGAGPVGLLGAMALARARLRNLGVLARARGQPRRRLGCARWPPSTFRLRRVRSGGHGPAKVRRALAGCGARAHHRALFRPRPIIGLLAAEHERA